MKVATKRGEKIKRGLPRKILVRGHRGWGGVFAKNGSVKNHFWSGKEKVGGSLVESRRKEGKDGTEILGHMREVTAV